MEALWQALAGDAETAQRALLRLAERKGEAVAFLKGRLKPAAPADPKRLEQLFADLDAKAFNVRTQAARGLEQLGDLALAAIAQRLAGKLPLETLRRLEQVRDRIVQAEPAPEVVRGLRAVEALERVGTAEARQVLAALAKGAAGHRLTEEAALALARLAEAPH
jgi:hypothetical protein